MSVLERLNIGVVGAAGRGMDGCARFADVVMCEMTDRKGDNYASTP
jgi:hypothetical protein